MTRSRTSTRSIAVALAAIAIAMLLLPARRVEAAEPPFQLFFPQDPDVTEHHDDWGASRAGGRAHQGNDLMAPKLTPVYAAADGIVDTVAESSRAGRYVILRHYGGWTTWYVHLNNDNPGTDDGRAPWSLTLVPGVEEGVFVRAGQQIGYVGDSGNAEWTGSHTHFELELDGRSVDPGPYLKEAKERAIDLEHTLARYSVLERTSTVL